MPTIRDTRYQGAIVQDDHILLLYGREGWQGPPREFWLLPGGGRDEDETAEQAVEREMLEETNLQVRVERLILNAEPHPTDNGPYRSIETYLCTPVRGEAAPGVEPEVTPALWKILDVGWFDLRDESGWPKELLGDPITYDQMTEIRKALGYR